VLTARSWKDYIFNEYCTSYICANYDYDGAKDAREQYTDYDSQTSDEFWGKLYYSLYEQNKERIGSLLDSLWTLKEVNDLDQFEFANAVVTFVQDIPYAYILDKERCEDQEEIYGNCVTDIKYGILSPVEFLYTLNGDCDTRTVLLYTIFRELGYEPKIANSDAYAHSILLLNVASGGNDYIYDRGRKFFFWETTAANWPSGTLPPDTRDLDKWTVVLN